MEWSLRDYGIESVVWDGDPKCEHQWGELINETNEECAMLRSKDGKRNGMKKKLENKKVNQGNFCSKCGAWKGSLGLEPTFELYIKHLCNIYDDVKRVLKKSGTCWVNIGDTYSAGGRSGSKKYFEKGHKQFGKNDPKGKYQTPKKVEGVPSKCLLMIPQRFAIEMINRGWILRNVIIWHKPSCMPESAKDRFTRDFEYVYFFVKNKKYWFERQREPTAESSKKRIKYSFENKRNYNLSVHKKCGNINNNDQIREGRKEIIQTCDVVLGRNKRTLWSVNPKGTKEAHFACVDEQTECLTLIGWKKYYDLQIGEIIPSFNLEKGILQWDRLKELHVYDYDNYLIELSGQTKGFQFTPNHRMVYITRNNLLKYRIKEAKDITSNDRFPIASEWEEGSYGLDIDEPNEDMCELLGWILSDGYFKKYSIGISQSLSAKPRNVERIEYLLQRLGLKYRRNDRNRISNIKGQIFESIMSNFYVNWQDAREIRNLIPNKQFQWKMILWSKEGIKRLLQGFIGGDGNIRKDGRISIIQKDKKRIDFLQILTCRLGYRCILSKRKDGIYTLSIAHLKTISARNTNGKGLNINNISYKGKVWCPETYNTTFIARRNGRIIITGNTFPPDLVKPMIKAGCPEYICDVCGTPRKKIVERTLKNIEGWGKCKKTRIDSPFFKNNLTENQGRMGDPFVIEKGYSDCGCETDEIGKNSPIKVSNNCGHNSKWKAGIVLDIFAGSGTTLKTAWELGRNYIGFEINKDYCNIAERLLRSTKNKRLSDFI